MDEPLGSNETVVGGSFGCSALPTLPWCLNGGHTTPPSTILKLLGLCKFGKWQVVVPILAVHIITNCFHAIEIAVLLAWMEEQQRSKRRRVYPVKSNAVACANFSHKYISHLLPALSKFDSMGSSNRSKDNEIKKIIRFEVDMALVLSTGEFRWSRALRHKLEHGMSLRKLYNTATLEPLTSVSTFNVEILGPSLPPLAIPRPVVHAETHANLKPDESSTLRKISWQQGVQRKESRREEDIDGHIETLRLLLPGGNEMGLSELLSEMESYVVCLQLQVNALRRLVGI